MILLIKKLVSRVLGLFGIGVYFLRDRRPDISVEWVEHIYRERGYGLSRKRLDFYTELLQALAANGVVLDGRSVLDIGCGDGQMLRMIQETSEPSRLAGLDISAEAVRLASDVPRAEIMRGDVLSLNGNVRGDIVLCVETLEHIADAERALGNVVATVSPGGYLFAVVPNGRADAWEGHTNFWSTLSWQVLVCPSQADTPRERSRVRCRVAGTCTRCGGDSSKGFSPGV